MKMRLFCGITLLIFAATVFGADSVRIQDDGDVGFSSSPVAQWSRTTGIGYQSDHLLALGSNATAEWSFSVNSGSYRVSITWPASVAPYNKMYSLAAPVSVSQAGQVLMSGSVNLQAAPVDRFDAGVGWKDLGVFNVTTTPLKVRLTGTSTLYTLADAVRIERTDGSPIESPSVISALPRNSPLSGGIAVTVRGTQFSAGSRVLFGSKEASQVTVVSATELVAISPPNSVGSVDITVITPDGLTGVLAGQFKYMVGRTLDNGDVGFTSSAPAFRTTGIGFEGDYLQPAGTIDATASWTMSVNKQPTHAVAVTWYDAGAPYNAVFSTDSRFEVFDGSKLLGSVPVNLQTKPGDFTDLGTGWKRLGNYSFPSGQARVVLRNNTASYLIADAIRVEELSAATTPPPVAVTVTASDETADEPADRGTFTFSRTGSTESSLTINYTVSGTATSGSDFTSLGNTVTFNAGSATAVKTLSPIDDTIVESDETIVLTLNSGAGYTLGTSTTATVLLTDNDVLPQITVAATSAAAAESGTAGAFTFTRTGSTTSSLTVNFAVTGTASGGSDYTALGTSVSFAAGSATVVKKVNPIDDATVEGTETVVASVTSGSGYVSGSPSSAMVTIEDNDSVSALEDLVVDNSDGPAQVTFVGTWTPSTSAALFQGVNYAHDGNTGKGGKSVTFTPTVGIAGNYEVFIWYTESSNRANNVPVDVIHSAGTTTILLNQRINGSQWVSLGTYRFETGTAGGVRLRTTGTSGYVIADAIRLTASASPVVTVVATEALATEPGTVGAFTFTRSGSIASSLTVNFRVGGTASSGSDFTVLGSSVTFSAGSATAVKTVIPIDDATAEEDETVVATLVAGVGYQVGSPSSGTVTIEDNDLASSVEDLFVDNSDGVGQVSLAGTWTSSTAAVGFQRVNYIHDGNTGKGSKSVTFIPPVETAGNYEVFIWYTEGSNRASNVPVDVIHSAGTTTILLNQRINGSRWISLGTYRFEIGTTGRVRLRTTATDGYVIADGVKLTFSPSLKAAGSLSPLMSTNPTIPDLPYQPEIKIQVENGHPVVSWLDSGNKFQLEQSTSLSPAAVWEVVPAETILQTDESRLVLVPSGMRFYRLSSTD